MNSDGTQVWVPIVTYSMPTVMTVTTPAAYQNVGQSMPAEALAAAANLPPL
jgi:hypothetical protein